MFSEPDGTGQPTGVRLLYCDQAGFDWHLPTSYSYSPVGETLGVPKVKGKRLNVTGAWDFVTCELEYEVFEGRCTSHRMLAFFERLSLESAQHPKRLTVVVLDKRERPVRCRLVSKNASIHTAQVIRDREAVWKDRQLHLAYLTPYSPERERPVRCRLVSKKLNLIERLWLAVKYQLLPRRCYKGLADLRGALEGVLSAFGRPQVTLTS